MNTRARVFILPGHPMLDFHYWPEGEDIDDRNLEYAGGISDEQFSNIKFLVEHLEEHGYGIRYYEDLELRVQDVQAVHSLIAGFLSEKPKGSVRYFDCMAVIFAGASERGVGLVAFCD